MFFLLTYLGLFVALPIALLILVGTVLLCDRAVTRLPKFRGPLMAKSWIERAATWRIL